jgi:hypothetical protein
VIDGDHVRFRRIGTSAEQGVDSLPVARILGGEVHAQSGDVDPPVHRARTILTAEVDVTEAIPPAAKAAVLRRGAAGRPITIDVRGSSMGKAIPSGARVLVAAGQRPRRGEVWAFVVDDGMVVVHRFRREHEGALWFQGDGNAGGIARFGPRCSSGGSWPSKSGKAGPVWARWLVFVAESDSTQRLCSKGSESCVDLYLKQGI